MKLHKRHAELKQYSDDLREYGIESSELRKSYMKKWIKAEERYAWTKQNPLMPFMGYLFTGTVGGSIALKLGSSIPDSLGYTVKSLFTLGAITGVFVGCMGFTTSYLYGTNARREKKKISSIATNQRNLRAGTGPLSELERLNLESRVQAPFLQTVSRGISDFLNPN